METRLIIHYLDGKTFKTLWNKACDVTLFNNRISSLQIQEDNGKLHTLSSKVASNMLFYSLMTDASISIFKRIQSDIWLQLKLNTEDGKTEITIIEENINA